MRRTVAVNVVSQTMIQCGTPGKPLGEMEANHYQKLVDAITDYAILMLDPKGCVASWNAGCQRIIGYTAEEIVGKHFSVFYRKEDQKAGLPEQALKEAREGRYECERWRVRKDGTTFWAMVVIDPIFDNDENLLGYAKITRDMTSKHETALQIEHAREQVFQSQKLEALGQLTGGLAHDFNNLLTTIISGTQMALRNHNDRGKQEELLNAVLFSAQRGGNLTRQLLAFARKQTLASNTVDLSAELPQMATLIRHSISAQIELVLEISDQLWKVDVDVDQLQLALLNVVFNARDAMPNGGVLKVKAANTELNGEPNGLTGCFVCVSICDTGTGIPEEIKNRVFEPFFTTKTFGKGTGLGLSQVYGFALQSRGALTVKSEESVGTTVTLYLPASASSSSSITNNHRLQRVLVVEDDPQVSKITVALLSDLNYEPIAVSSGREALSKLTRDNKFDLVFADVIMPGGMTGVELARKLRERLPELPVLLTTGYSEQATDSSEFPVLPKPYDCNALERMMKVLIQRGHTGPFSDQELAHLKEDDQGKEVSYG